MANLRYRSQFHQSYAALRASLFATINFGATGAPTIVSGTGMGIASITRSSAGTYVIALTQPFNTLLGVRHTFVDPSAAPASPSLYVSSNAVASRSAPALTVVFNAAGTATDPASGESVLLEIVLNNSALSY
jgi:hypothetical protein